MDPLDAFMAAEVNPEVKAKEAEERQRKEEERKEFAKQVAVGPNFEMSKSLAQRHMIGLVLH